MTLLANFINCSFRWVHLVCALYTPGVAFGDVDKLNNVTLFEMPYSKWGAKAGIFLFTKSPLFPLEKKVSNIEGMKVSARCIDVPIIRNSIKCLCRRNRSNASICIFFSYRSVPFVKI